jgi:hypothetical protein
MTSLQRSALSFSRTSLNAAPRPEVVRSDLR